MIDQGDWDQAQQKLQAVSTQVQSVDDVTTKTDLIEQWNELSVKVGTRDANATLPPSTPGEPAVPPPAGVTLLELPAVTSTTTVTTSTEDATHVGRRHDVGRPRRRGRDDHDRGDHDERRRPSAPATTTSGETTSAPTTTAPPRRRRLRPTTTHVRTGRHDHDGSGRPRRTVGHDHASAPVDHHDVGRRPRRPRAGRRPRRRPPPGAAATTTVDISRAAGARRRRRCAQPQASGDSRTRQPRHRDGAGACARRRRPRTAAAIRRSGDHHDGACAAGWRLTGCEL